MSKKKRKATTDGPGPVPGETGVPAPGSAREHIHNSPGGFPSAAARTRRSLGPTMAGTPTPLEDGKVVGGQMAKLLCLFEDKA